MRFHSFAAASSMLLWLPSLAAAQGASLSVTVKDNYGVIPAADVRVAPKDALSSRRELTDAAGTAAFSDLAPGTYTVRASFTGFVDKEQQLSLLAGERKSVELVLQLTPFSTEVTVTTANRREQLLLDVAEPTTLIDEAQILDSGSRTAKDLLVQQAGSGVQVNAGGGQGHVSVNGIPNSGVLVLLDGRRFLGRDANGNFNIEEIALAGIERVEVVRGPSSALYGADALGGVINFVTKKAQYQGFRNTLSLLGGSYGDLRGSDSVSFRRGNGGVTVYGAYRQYDGYDLDGDRGPQTIGQPESSFKSAGLSGDYRFSGKLVGRVFADYNKRDIDKYFFAGPTQQASTVYNSVRDLTRVMLAPELEFSPRTDTSFNVSYNYGRYLRDETQIFTLDGRVAPQAPWREWNRELKLGGRHDFHGFGRKHSLQAGYENREEKLRRGTLTRTDPERDINVFWFQQELDLGRLKLAGGARRDDYSDFGSRWSPKASALLAFAGSHRLRATYGQGFRPPYFGELYLNTPPSFVGNPELKPEINAGGWTAGYSYAGPKAFLYADFFTNDIENGIVFDLTRTPFTYGNLREYRSRGWNASGGVNLRGGFSPSIDYTFTKRQDTALREIGGFPRHALYAKLLWSKPSLGLRANIRGEWNGKVPPGITDVRYQPAYSVFYAQVNKRLARRGAYAWSAWAQLSNIFDERDVYALRACPATGAPANCVAGTPITTELLQVWIAPRTFQAGITIEMDWTK
jgi:outer membrane receptor for ferrienterochelin and colicins